MSQPRAARPLALMLALLACACIQLAANAASLGSYLGAQVQEIDFSSEIPSSSNGNLEREKQELQRILPIKIGDALTRQKLRDSIQALQSTGLFSSIEVEATRTAENKLSLTFVTKPNFFIGSVKVEGAPQPPSASQLANAAKLELGQHLSVASLDHSVSLMKRVMEDNGYFKSAIKTEYALDAATQQATIVFNIAPSDRALVGKISVTGDPGISVEEVMDVAKLHPGNAVAVSKVTRALQRLRKRYQKQKRLEAQVSVTDRKYHPETNTLDYTFNIERGQKVDIVVEGAKLRPGLVKKYVPVYEENAVDDDLLNEGRRNLRDYFQTKGYFDVNVDYTKRVNVAPDEHTAIVFNVDARERHKLVDLTIEGNKLFDKQTIRERMQIQPASLLLFYGRFSQSMLVQDIAAVESLYTENGFRHVKVTSSVQDDYQGQGNIRVIIHIDEGPQTLVQSLKIEGNKSFGEDQLLNLINNLSGQPYSDFNLANDRDAVLNFYFDKGFPDVRFEAFTDEVKPNQISLTYRVTEGEQRFVNRILVAGLEHTRPYIVSREFQLQPTKPLSQSQMLDTQRRLYDLGIFNEANVAVQNPQGSFNQKNVIVQVDEAKRYTFNYGFGFEASTSDAGGTCLNTVANGGQTVTCSPQGSVGASPRVSFDVTRINFLGRDHTVLIKTVIGRLQQRALVSYEAPRWFNSEDKTLTFTAFYDNTQDVRTFSAERLEGATQVRHLVNKGTTLLYRFTYRRVRVDPNTLQVSPDQIPLLSKPVRVGFPSLTFIRDTRDDPINSRRGTYTAADVSVASGIFGSESNFAKLLLQNSTYYQLNKNAKVERRWVFARSTRIGIEEPFGSASQSFVPLPERFFAGGGSSHRGFGINQAGPRDLQTGFPLGGNALFVNNLELRTPPIALPYVDDNLSAVFFHDAGNVFATPGEMFRNLFRVTQRSVASCRDVTNPNAGCDFNYVSHAIGGGLRYKTPIGPVRVDLGYNLNPTAFPIRTTTPPHSENLRRFNFYFSIGQTF